MVSIPRRLASSKARSRFGELPLVDSPTAMSPRPPNAASCRENTTSTPMSLHSAVTTAVSLASPNAGKAGTPPPGSRNSVASCCASGAPPASADSNLLPAGRDPPAAPPRALRQPRAVALADDPPQLQDLLGLGRRGGAHLLEHGGQVRRVRVEERVQRLHRGITVRGAVRAAVRAAVRGAVRGRRAHQVTTSPARCTTAIASLACTRIVSPAAADTSATLTSSQVPWPVSTTASESGSSRSTVTSTAMSPQVMQ